MNNTNSNIHNESLIRELNMSQVTQEEMHKQIDKVKLEKKELKEIENKIEEEINQIFSKKNVVVMDQDGNMIEKDVYIDKDGNVFSQEQIDKVKEGIRTQKYQQFKQQKYF